MALTVIVFLLVIFSIGLFAIFTRCFADGVRHGSAPEAAVQQHPPPRPPPPDLSISQYYHRRHLTPSVGAAGLDPRTVRALPVLTYTGGAKVGGCVVCLGEFEEKERVKVIPGCGHVFHPDCIDSWLVLHGSCPICRCSHLFGAGAGAGAGAGNAGEVWVNVDGGGPHEEEDSSSSEEESEDGGAREDRREERTLVGLGRSESFRYKGEVGGGGGESCTTFLRRTCSF